MSTIKLPNPYYQTAWEDVLAQGASSVTYIDPSLYTSTHTDIRRMDMVHSLQLLEDKIRKLEETIDYLSEVITEELRKKE